MENNAPQKKQLPAFLILTIIAVVAAAVLAVTNMITAGPIAEHAMAALKDAFNAVMPAESYEEMTVLADYEVSSLYAAKNGGDVIGYCVTASSNGYGGPVAVTLGVDLEGVVTGCSVGDTSFAETAGFGLRAKEASFQDQFPGISAIDGGSFEALSGATVTSEAVRASVNKGLKCVAEVALGATQNTQVTFGAPAPKAEKPAPVLTGAVQEGAARGFQSEVKVQLTVEGGVISALTILSGDETPGFGTRCAEDEAFINQFVGQAGPFTLGENIDALSGATVTSTAVVEAVNAALTAPAAAAGETVTGTAKGFQSDVTVTLTVEDGAIASVMIASGDETPGFGTRCAEDEAFLNQFIGKAAPLTLGEGIDALAGATVTSTAVVEAANAALANVGAAEEPATVIAEGENATLAVKADGAAIVTPNEGFTGDVDVKVSVENGKVTAGEFTAPAPGAEPAPVDNIIGVAQGFQSEVNVGITLNEDGSIAALSIGSADETPGFGTRCAEDEAFINQFIGKTAPFAIGENVDALSGATVTSEAVVEAINTALAAEEQPAAPAGEEFTGKAQGFQSEVAVTLTVADGVITAIKVDSANETPGFGTRCAEDEAFLNQFVGKKVEVFTLGENVDALSGATVTSQAVVEAINASSTVVASAEAVPAATEVPTEEPAAELTAEPVAEAAVEELTAKAPGFIDADVGVTVTLDAEGNIATLTIDNSQQMPPVCDLVDTDEFKNQFIGKKGPFVKGEGVDIVTGATFTSEGVINALNTLFPAEEAVEEVKEEAPAVEELTAKAPGFIDADVGVTVTLDAEGNIATLTIDNSQQMPPVCDLVDTDEFKNQFIGKKGPFVKGEGVDIVTGATFTSEGVINALNSLFPAEEVVEEVKEEAPAAEELTAKAPGFIDADVGVTVTLDAEGNIATLTIDNSQQVPPVCDQVDTDEFKNQFIGKKGPFVKGEGVDIVTGATFTSEGVINALNTLFPAEEAVEEVKEEAPAAEELTAKAPGFIDADVGVTVTLDAEGNIATLAIDNSQQMPPVCDLVDTDEFKNQFIGKKGPFVKGEGVDIVTGATFTSEGVINALNTLFPAEEIKEEEAPAVEELTAKAPGFIDADVGVTVTLDAEGNIATLAIDNSQQMPPVCDLVDTDEFKNQFIGKKGPFVKGEGVDIVTGATFTSEGVINALNTLFPAEEIKEEETPAVEELTAKAPGFIDADVGVTVTLDAEGNIATLAIDNSQQMPPVCDLVDTDEFKNQFIGKKGPFVKGEGVDIVTGATFTSEGVINALNTLFPAEEAVEEVKEEAPAVEELTAKAPGFIDADVGVTVTLDAEGNIATLTIDNSQQMPPVCDLVDTDEFKNQFIGKKGPFVKGEGVDIVTGATFTSEGVINALNSLFE